MKEAADFDQMAKSIKADFPYLYYSKCSVRRNSHTMGVAALILRVVVGVVFVPSVVVAVYVPVAPSSLRVTVLQEDVPSHCKKVSLEFLVAAGRRAIVETIEQAWG